LLDTAALIGLHGSPAGTRAELTEETV